MADPQVAPQAAPGAGDDDFTKALAAIPPQQLFAQPGAQAAPGVQPQVQQPAPTAQVSPPAQLDGGYSQLLQQQQQDDETAAQQAAASSGVDPSVTQALKGALHPGGFGPAENFILGAEKGLFNAKDLIFGEPAQADKSQTRQLIEARSEDLARQGVVNGIAQTLGQFGIGFIGLGKIKYVGQGLEWLSTVGKGARWAGEAAKGAAIGSTFLDPHMQRLSNLVEAYPALNNPLSDYLASKPGETNAEGRLKNALEGVIMDAALSTALARVAKSIKAYRAGDLEGANLAASQADEQFQRAANQASAEQKAAAVQQEASALKQEPGATTVSGTDKGGPGGDSLAPTATGPAADSLPGGGGDLNVPGASADASPGGARDGAVPPGEAPVADSAARGEAGGAVAPKTPPAEIATVPLKPEDVSKALAKAQRDTAAITTWGSRWGASQAGHSFNELSADTSGLIPWQKLNTTENTYTWMKGIIDEQAGYINTIRGGDKAGILGDEAVQRMVDLRSRVWNEDPARLMGALQAAGDKAPEMAANMETSFLLANKAFQDAYQLAVRINSDNYTGFFSRTEALQELQKRMVMSTAMYANGKTILSNSARALRRMRGEFKLDEAQLANLKNADPSAILKLVTDTGGSPAQLAKTARFGLLNRIGANVSASQAAGLLWSWKTQVLNFATSATNLVWRPLETGIGAVEQQALGAIRGDADLVAQARSLRQQALKEVTYSTSMLSDAFFGAAKAFYEGDSALIPRASEHFASRGLSKFTTVNDLSALEWRPFTSIEGLAFNAYQAAQQIPTLPLRSMGAADEFVKVARYRAVVAAQAHVEADAAGLQGKALKDFVSNKLESATDDAGRAVDPDAIAEAKSSTFQDAYAPAEETHFGAWAQGAAHFVADKPLARIFVPYMQTPVNLFRYGVKLTPGLNLLQKQYWTSIAGQAGAESQARAMGQMTLGIMMASMASYLWASGRLTGSGPRDATQRREWIKEGNREFSIVWHNDKGEKQFFELNRVDPLGMPLTMIADAASLMFSGQLREEEARGLPMAIVLSISHMMTNKTYLKNITDALSAITDDKKMDVLARRMVPGLLPMSSLMGMATDPYLHETRNIMDAIQARVPGLSAHLPPQRDIFGDKVLAPTGLVSTQKNTGPLMSALDENVAVTGRFLEPVAPKNANTGGVDLRDFKLADGRTAYDRYAELAGHPSMGADGKDAGGIPSLKDQLNAFVQSDVYKQLPFGGPTEDGTKAGEIMGIVKQYRTGAWNRMLAESPELRQAVYQRKLDIAKAIATGQQHPSVAGEQGRLGVFNTFLHRYGLNMPSANLPRSTAPTTPAP
jgi:hypothetical protein